MERFFDESVAASARREAEESGRGKKIATNGS
jgi:hypothetical protein